MDKKEKVYSDQEIAAKIAELGLDGWYLEDGWLRRKYNTDGWPTTLMLVNAVGYLCEAAWHHADLAVTWGKVWVKLKTHSAGGITDKDFALAHEDRGRGAVAAGGGRPAARHAECVRPQQDVGDVAAIGTRNSPTGAGNTQGTRGT